MLAALLLSGASLLAAAPAVAERPIEQFAQLPAMTGLELSPNGKMIAMKMASEGVQQLTVFPIEGEGLSSKVTIEDTDLYDYFWVNDDWIVLKVGKVDNSISRTMVIYRLISFNVKTRKMVLLGPKDGMGQNGADVLWVARDGSPKILLSYQASYYSDKIGFYPEVALVDVSKNSIDHVVSPMEGVFNWIADADGTVRAGFGSEFGGRRTRLLYRPDGSSGFREVGNDVDNPELPFPVVFLAAEGKAAGYSDKDGADALYQIDLATMTHEKLIYGAPGYDIDSIRLDVTGRRILGVSYTDQRQRMQWFDPSFRALQTALGGAIKGDVALTSINRMQDRVIAAGTSPSGPTSYYYFNIPSQQMTFIGSEYPAFGNEPLAPVRTVAYKSRDGLDLQAVLTLPKGKEAKNLPIIVLPHGGPGARDDESFDWWTQFLADRGYAVLQPNYRGSTGFGNAFHAAGDGEWGLKMQDDVDDALAWAVAEGIADKGRACIVGGSYGGYVAMRAAERNPDLYRCAVSFAGVSDLEKLMSYDSKFVNDLATRDYWNSRAVDFDAVSPINRPQAVGIPVLVVHGKRDLRVPVAQSRDYAAALKKAGKDVTYIEQPLGDHHFTRQEDRLQFLQAMETFLDRFNPA